MDAEKIIQILIETKGYNKEQTERLLPKIVALPSDIKNALDIWIEKGQIQSLEYYGYNVEKILKEKPTLTTLGAFLMLDWIRKDPKNAIKALNQKIMKRL